MPRALVPLAVAHELPHLVGRLATRLETEALDQLVAISPTVGEFRARTLVAIALADVEHCFQVTEESGRELPRARWDALLTELRRIDVQLEQLHVAQEAQPGTQQGWP